MENTFINYFISSVKILKGVLTIVEYVCDRNRPNLKIHPKRGYRKEKNN